MCSVCVWCAVTGCGGDLLFFFFGLFVCSKLGVALC